MESIKEVPQSVKVSKFGCGQCLWQCCECQQGSLYRAKDNSEECQAYTYYD